MKKDLIATGTSDNCSPVQLSPAGPTDKKMKKWTDKEPELLEAIHAHNLDQLQSMYKKCSFWCGNLLVLSGISFFFAFIGTLLLGIDILGLGELGDSTAAITFCAGGLGVGLPSWRGFCSFDDKTLFLQDKLDEIKRHTYKVIRQATDEGLEVKLVKTTPDTTEVLESRVFTQDIESDLIEASNYLAELEEKRREKLDVVKAEEAIKNEKAQVKSRAQELNRLLPSKL